MTNTMTTDAPKKKVQPVYPTEQMSRFYQWLQRNKADLHNLNPARGQKTEYTHSHKAGRSGGQSGTKPDPIDIQVADLIIDFERSWLRSDYPEATPLYYRLKQLLSY